MTMAEQSSVATRQPVSTRSERGAPSRLSNEVGAAAGRLHRQMLAVQASYGLGRRELAATQRAVRQLLRVGQAPAANDFWETTAQPRAQRLTRLGIAVIDEEMTRLQGGVRPRMTSKHRFFDLSHASAPPQRTIEPMIEDLRLALSAANRIDELGRWWQRRLRRAALIRALPTIATHTPGEAELLISSAEMELLDRGPWSHSDRFLSAFELANREIQIYANHRFTQILQTRILSATSPRSQYLEP
ncbi:MAG: hypothetical protein GY724_04390 [Actinomycetia bacterium]|nr:hypothetical protein [Actinomycetes bacterium]MCP5032910.1 hypothetical protein [Actinomycetes bacterium]